MTKNQEVLLEFFRRYPYFSLFIATFGNLEKEFAAVGIVLMALEKGEWGTSLEELNKLRQEQGSAAVEKWRTDYQAFDGNRKLIREFEKWNFWTLGIYGLFAQKPPSLDEPERGLLLEFTQTDGSDIGAGCQKLHDEGFVVFGDDDSITPTDKFFELLLAKYRQKGFIPA